MTRKIKILNRWVSFWILAIAYWLSYPAARAAVFDRPPGISMGGGGTTNYLAAGTNVVVVTNATLWTVNVPDLTAGTSTSATNANLTTVASEGAAVPYPSTITNSGIASYITGISVGVNGFNHNLPTDVILVLIGPDGTQCKLMEDCGSNALVGGPTHYADLLFTDTATAYVPAATIISGTYLPTVRGAVATPTAPANGPYSTNLTIFRGTTPNGIWSLYTFDGVALDGGYITNWTLTLVTGTLSDYARLSSASNSFVGSASWAGQASFADVVTPLLYISNVTASTVAKIGPDNTLTNYASGEALPALSGANLTALAEAAIPHRLTNIAVFSALNLGDTNAAANSLLNITTTSNHWFGLRDNNGTLFAHGVSDGTNGSQVNGIGLFRGYTNLPQSTYLAFQNTEGGLYPQGIIKQIFGSPDYFQIASLGSTNRLRLDSQSDLYLGVVNGGTFWLDNGNGSGVYFQPVANNTIYLGSGSNWWKNVFTWTNSPYVEAATYCYVTNTLTALADIVVGLSLQISNNKAIKWRDSGGTLRDQIILTGGDNLNIRNNATGGDVFIGTATSASSFRLFSTGDMLLSQPTTISTNLFVGNKINATNGVATFYRTSPTTITVAGSPVNWTNTTTVNVSVYVDGVSVTGTVGINGTTIFNTIGQCTVADVEPGDWVTITYTIGTPTAWYR